jgi:chondroitin AC lyase
LGEVKGKWSVINKAQPDSLVSDRIFMPVMLSDTDAGELSTGYVLARCSSPREAMKLSRKSAWKILSNDNRCQAVKFSDGDLMGAFFTADSMRTRSRLSLAVDRPCLILIKGKTVYASDPLHQGGILHVLFNSRRWRVILPQDGTTVKGIAIRQVSATSPDN